MCHEIAAEIHELRRKLVFSKSSGLQKEQVKHLVRDIKRRNNKLMEVFSPFIFCVLFYLFVITVFHMHLPQINWKFQIQEVICVG